MNSLDTNFKEEFGIETDHLYEIVATTFSRSKFSEEIIPNTSSMGIRLNEKKRFIITPYPNTKTFQNLESHHFVVINFVDNIYMYALAALKERGSKINLESFPMNYYAYLIKSNSTEIQNYLPHELKNLKFNIPYIKQAWGIVIGFIDEKKQRQKENGLGKINLTEFSIKPIYANIIRSSHKLFNRAENLALEMIILATRLKIAYINERKDLISSIQEKISQFDNDIRRFSKNSQVLKTINLVQKYCTSLELT